MDQRCEVVLSAVRRGVLEAMRDRFSVYVILYPAHFFCILEGSAG